MINRLIASGIIPICLIVLLAASPLPAQKPRIKKSQSIYVVAVRDSRLLTMCPPAIGTIGKGRDKGGEIPATFQVLPDDMEMISIASHPSSSAQPNNEHPALHEDPPYVNGVGMIPDMAPRANSTIFAPPVQSYTSSVVILPVNCSSTSDHDELDRVTPDASLKNEIEKALQNQQQYQVTVSLDKADFVFLAESTTIPLQLWVVPEPPRSMPSSPGYTSFLGDQKPDFLNAVLGLVVPAQAYRQNSANPVALLTAEIWEGSSVWADKAKSLPKGLNVKLETYLRNIIPASPEELVKQFLGKEKIPSNHLPLCPASSKARGMPGIEHEPGLPQSNEIREVGTLVSVPAVVRDTNGKYVSDLNVEDFHVFDNNVEQKIERVFPPTDPIDMILMLDTSSSTRAAFEEMQRWALEFVDALRPQDRLMAVTFDNQVFVLSDFTGDRDKLRGAMFKVRKGESTRLYDALNLLAADRLPAATGRRAMVLFTDGVDTRSRLAEAADALGSIERSNMPVFVIRFDTKAVQQSGRRRPEWRPIIVPDGVLDNSSLCVLAEQFLGSLVEESGGLIYQAQSNDSSDGPVPPILDELHHQYVLCFRSTDTTQRGLLHSIHVSVARPDVKVLCRTSYRASLQ